MVGTVKHFKDILEEMKTIYPFDDEKTKMSTFNIISRENRQLEICTIDEKTGVTIVMSKAVPIIEF